MFEFDARLEQVRTEWLALTHVAPPDAGRFEAVRREAHALIEAGRWTSGPPDLLSILGHQRDELAHSRLIAWLLVPTNQHGLGRAVLTGFLDRLWPEEALLRSGPVFVETEVTGGALDDLGTTREARADVVLRGEGLTVIIENKLDAGEQPDQCERLYWAWASEPGDVRWVFLTPTGRAPMTTSSEVAAAAWHAMSYADLRDTVQQAIEAAGANTSTGRASALQYFATLARAVAPPR